MNGGSKKLMTRYQINVNLNQALDQARKLENAASDLERQVVAKLDDVAGELHAAWKGESATVYISKEQSLRDEIKSTASEMRSIADDIRRTANRIAQAELEALRIAEQRELL